MQLRMLARRSISGSMTVVGDVAQATGSRAPSGWDEVIAHLTPKRPAHVAELSVNYRTPAEIMDVAAPVLAAADPRQAPPRSVRTTGTVPRFVPTRYSQSEMVLDLAEVIREELEAVEGGNVAVICADGAYERWAIFLDAAKVDFGRPERDGLEAPVTLVPVGIVKGLEFDSVVVVEPSAIVAEGPQGLRALYVSLTRATRRLAVVHSLGLPEVLQGPGDPPT